jgi:DNA-nicking Smr family endonuclease
MKRSPAQTPEPFYNPFRQQWPEQLEGLERASKRVETTESSEKPLPPRLSGWKNRHLSDDELLKREMSDVLPLPENRFAERAKVPVSVKPSSAEEDALQALIDLVNGEGEFDLTHHDEHVEGSQRGLDPRIMSKLRQGEYSWQAYLDLHGMIVETAREALKEFIVEQRRRNNRCILIVHGRGLHSLDQEPVLKRQLINWLTRGFLRKQILAFATARQFDGGTGAMYILLRK